MTWCQVCRPSKEWFSQENGNSVLGIYYHCRYLSSPTHCSLAWIIHGNFIFSVPNTFLTFNNCLLAEPNINQCAFLIKYCMCTISQKFRLTFSQLSLFIRVLDSNDFEGDQNVTPKHAPLPKDYFELKGTEKKERQEKTSALLLSIWKQSIKCPLWSCLPLTSPLPGKRESILSA